MPHRKGSELRAHGAGAALALPPLPRVLDWPEACCVILTRAGLPLCMRTRPPAGCWVRLQIVP